MAVGPDDVEKEGIEEQQVSAPANERQAQEKLSEAQRRLKKLMDVNRKLHTTLADKKIRAAEMKKQNDEMLAKLESREVEELGRHRQVQELQGKLHGDQTSQQVETLQLQKAVMLLEERIEKLNEENLLLGERHKATKAQIVDQQNAMKMLQRRAKELSRHIEYMAGHLNEVQAAQLMELAATDDGDENRPNIESRATDSSDSPTKEPHQKPRAVTDFKRLPGLDLTKLLGEDAPSEKEKRSSVRTGSAASTAERERPTSPNRSTRAKPKNAGGATGGKSERSTPEPEELDRARSTSATPSQEPTPGEAPPSG